MSLTNLVIMRNQIGNKGAAALADALQVNTSLTSIHLYKNAIDELNHASVDALVARNKRLRSLFLFDARKMLLSLMRGCADECGVVWLYFIASSAGDDDNAVPDNIESIRIELTAVVSERCRRELCRPVLVADVRALQRETSNQFAKQSNQIAVLNDIVSGQTNQIADLQRSTNTTVEQNQLMQEQMRQMHALLMSREEEQESSADVDEGGSRVVKRRRTNR
jgi:hypothetical protein